MEAEQKEGDDEDEEEEERKMKDMPEEYWRLIGMRMRIEALDQGLDCHHLLPLLCYMYTSPRRLMICLYVIVKGKTGHKV